MYIISKIFHGCEKQGKLKTNVFQKFNFNSA